MTYPHLGDSRHMVGFQDSTFTVRSKGDINEKEQVQTGRKSVQSICSVLGAYRIYLEMFFTELDMLIGNELNEYSDHDL